MPKRRITRKEYRDMHHVHVWQSKTISINGSQVRIHECSAELRSGVPCPETDAYELEIIDPSRAQGRNEFAANFPTYARDLFKAL